MKNSKEKTVTIRKLTVSKLIAYMAVGLGAGFIVGYTFTKIALSMM